MEALPDCEADALIAGKLPNGFVSPRQIAGGLLKRTRRWLENPTGLVGISTGIHDLDLILGGVERGDFLLFASRPSMGKSALCLQICSHVAVTENKPVAIFGYDRSAQDIARRIVINREEIDCSMYCWGAKERSMFEQGVMKLADDPLLIDAPCQKTLNELLECCRELRATVPDLIMILIDDIQGLLQQEAVDIDGKTVSCELKRLAEETETIVIAASQVSRVVDERQNKRPLLRDLRQWGRLEYAADVVCGLYREEYYDPDTKARGVAELDILRNTKGPPGTIDLQYAAFCGRFELNRCLNPGA